MTEATTAQRLTYLAATHTRQLNAAALAAYLAEFHGAVHGQARQPAALRDTAVKELTNVRHWALNRVDQK